MQAAGGVVSRSGEGGALEVLLVHRPKYDDWTLPKGKLEPGETHEQAALREVEEETGFTCELGPELPSTSYRDSKDRPKVVRYWAMRPIGGAFSPHHEVDEIRWAPVEEAKALLTYDHDLGVLNAFAETERHDASAPPPRLRRPPPARGRRRPPAPARRAGPPSRRCLPRAVRPVRRRAGAHEPVRALPPVRRAARRGARPARRGTRRAGRRGVAPEPWALVASSGTRLRSSARTATSSACSSARSPRRARRGSSTPTRAAAPFAAAFLIPPPG